MRLVRVKRVLGRVSIVAGWPVEPDPELEVIDERGNLVRECPLGGSLSFPHSPDRPPATVEGVVYSADIHGGKRPCMCAGGVDGKAVAVLLAADEVATPAPFSVLKWRPHLGYPKWRKPEVPAVEGELAREYRESLTVGYRPLMRVDNGWAERSVYSLRPWDAVALWQTPESQTFPSEMGRLGDLMGGIDEPEEKMLGVVLNERGRVRFIDADYWAKWERNLPSWVQNNDRVGTRT